jgi:hypothetical protein
MRHALPSAARRPAAIATVAAALALGSGTAAAAGPPASETVYFQGHTAQINTGAAVLVDASAGLLHWSSPIYIIGFPVLEGTTGPITLPSGYQPQHNGLPPAPIPYHDHVLAAGPGLGTSGTAGEYGAPLRVVQMRYRPTYAYSTDFVPITSADQIPAAEAAGKLDIVDPGAPDPYQAWTSTVLIRPVLPRA